GLAARDLGGDRGHLLRSGVHFLEDHGDGFARLLDLPADLLARRDVLHEIEALGQVLDRAVLPPDAVIRVLDGADEAPLLGVGEAEPADLLRKLHGHTVQLAGGRAEQARAGLQATHPLEVLIARARQPPDPGDGALDDAELLLDRLLGLFLGDREHLFERPALLLDALGGREDLRITQRLRESALRTRFSPRSMRRAIA